MMGLGAAPLGGLYKVSSQADAVETIGAALAAGINFVDIAPHYGQGLAERRVGGSLEALAAGELVLSTKVGRLLEPGGAAPSAPNWPEALPYSTVYDTTPDGIRRSLRDSIERLGGRAPSMLLLHDPDRYADAAGLPALIRQAYETLSALREAGVVTAIGVGVNAPEPCRMALDIGDWDCFLLAGSYSVLRQEDEGLLDACRKRRTSVLIGGPYMSGALAGGSTWRYRAIPAAVAADIARLEGLCGRYGVPMQAVALQFPLRHPAVASVIVGMRSAAEVAQNIGFLHASVPVELWDELAAEGFIPADLPRGAGH